MNPHIFYKTVYIWPKYNRKIWEHIFDSAQINRECFFNSLKQSVKGGGHFIFRFSPLFPIDLVEKIMSYKNTYNFHSRFKNRHLEIKMAF